MGAWKVGDASIAAKSREKHVAELASMLEGEKREVGRPWRLKDGSDDMEVLTSGTSAFTNSFRSKHSWAFHSTSTSPSGGLPSETGSAMNMLRSMKGVPDAALSAEPESVRLESVEVKAGLKTLTSDQKAEASVTNPNKEPIELMMTQLARLDAQAEHLSSSTKTVLKDYEEVVTGRVSADEIKSRYASSQTQLDSIVEDMDLKADKCQNLYQYACGGFLKRHPVPSGSAGATYSHSRTFHQIDHNNYKIKREIITNVPSEQRIVDALKSMGKAIPSTLTVPKDADSKYDQSELSEDQKQAFRGYYSSCIDIDGQTKRGVNDPTFKLYLKEINALKDVESIISFVGAKELGGLSLGPVAMDVGPDMAERKVNTAYIAQPELSMPDPAYYYAKDIKVLEEVKTAYTDTIGKVFAAVGYTGDPARVLKFETSLAQEMVSPEEMQSPAVAYNPTTFDDFIKKIPTLEPYLKAIEEAYPKMSGDSRLVIVAPAFFLSLEKILKGDAVLEELRDFVAWCLFRQLGGMLGKEISEILLSFFGTTLKGMKLPVKKKKEEKSAAEKEAEKKILAYKCQQETTKELWGYTDRVYVERTFPKEAQVQMEVMMNNIKAEFKLKLESNKWMDPFTKKEALKKLQEMNYKIGAPTRWPDYPFQATTEYLTNKINLWKHATATTISQYGQGVDNTKWGMNPSQVNAYYAMQKNEMVFPAGILQPPFFSVTQPMVVNYASIGSVMGHELSHGFDNTGAMYDKYGKYRDWWSKETKEAFETRAKCFPPQYTNLPLPDVQAIGMQVDGEKTLGENIADNGGVGVSNAAYGRYASQYGAATLFKAKGEAFTADQLFWIGWGQAWCKSQGPKSLEHQINGDVHAPSSARVNGVAMNKKSFGEAFGCKEGSDILSPTDKDRCALW